MKVGKRLQKSAEAVSQRGGRTSEEEQGHSLGIGLA
jgi:hypothetical protein